LCKRQIHRLLYLLPNKSFFGKAKSTEKPQKTTRPPGLFHLLHSEKAGKTCKNEKSVLPLHSAKYVYNK